MIAHAPLLDIVPYIGATYQLRYQKDPIGGNSLVISGVAKNDVCDFRSVGLMLDSVHLQQGTYNIGRYGDHCFGAIADRKSQCSPDDYSNTKPIKYLQVN